MLKRLIKNSSNININSSNGRMLELWALIQFNSLSRTPKTIFSMFTSDKPPQKLNQLVQPFVVVTFPCICVCKNVFCK